MSRIATGSGDEGQTSLFGGERVSKAHPAVEAYGMVDELGAALGLAWSAGDASVRRWVERIQAELFAVGAELATPGAGATRLAHDDVVRLEAELDELESSLPPLKTFVLPSGSELSGRFHLARAICRRAERAVVALHEGPHGPVGPVVRVYLNRLADLLFLKARAAALAEDGETAMDFARFRRDP